MRKFDLLGLLVVLAILSIVTISCSKKDDISDDIVDADISIFDSVIIGNQTWMAENLKLTHYPNGDPIPNLTKDIEWASLGNNNNADAYSYYYNDKSLGNGILYTYAAAKKVCPKGWHLPSHAEWIELEDFIKSEAPKNVYVGEILKATSGWANWGINNDLNGNGIDTYGFNALPCGWRNPDFGDFDDLECGVMLWTSTEIDEKMVYGRALYSDSGLMYGRCPKSLGGCVRCIRDSI